MERLASIHQERGVTLQRDGDCPTGLDRIARGYVHSRGICDVDKFPADWKRHKNAAGAIRNREMLDGQKPGQFAWHVAGLLVAFPGHVGTADCVRAANDRSIEVIQIEPVEEPHVWNMYHRWRKRQPQPPGLMYVGRSPQHGGPSPLANPFRLDPKLPRETQADDILGRYRSWLWAKIQAGDRAVLEALDEITVDTWLGCTCWPLPCHAEVILAAWHWRRFGVRRSPGHLASG